MKIVPEGEVKNFDISDILVFVKDATPDDFVMAVDINIVPKGIFITNHDLFVRTRLGTV